MVYWGVRGSGIVLQGRGNLALPGRRDDDGPRRRDTKARKS